MREDRFSCSLWPKCGFSKHWSPLLHQRIPFLQTSPVPTFHRKFWKMILLFGLLPVEACDVLTRSSLFQGIYHGIKRSQVGSTSCRRSAFQWNSDRFFEQKTCAVVGKWSDCTTTLHWSFHFICSDSSLRFLWITACGSVWSLRFPILRHIFQTVVGSTT